MIDKAAEQADLWSKHGLPGLVIFALLLIIVGSVWLSSKTTKEQRAEHREERKEWRESSERQSDKLEAAITGLSAAVREKRV